MQTMTNSSTNQKFWYITESRPLDYGWSFFFFCKVPISCMQLIFHDSCFPQMLFATTWLALDTELATLTELAIAIVSTPVTFARTKVRLSTATSVAILAKYSSNICIILCLSDHAYVPNSWCISMIYPNIIMYSLYPQMNAWLILTAITKVPASTSRLPLSREDSVSVDLAGSERHALVVSSP